MRVKAYVFGGADVAGLWANVGLLALRVSAGLAMAAAHGWPKLPPSSGFIDAVGGMGFPLPVGFAWAAGLAEFLGGILVALGLLTRPAAWSVALTMAVATFVRHGGDDFGTKEPAFLYLAIFLAVALIGAGRLSLDATLRPEVRPGRLKM